jgi:hypothetical protein
MEAQKKMAQDFIKELMEIDFKKYESFAPDAVIKARKCMKYFNCLGCLDTKRLLHTTDGYWHGIYYDEYTCTLCTGSRDFKTRHNTLTDAISYNRRQIPCNDTDKRSTYSHTANLSRIYELEYEAKDKAEADKDRAVKAAKADAERMKADADQLQRELDKKASDLKLEADQRQRELDKKASDLKAEADQRQRELDKKASDLKADAERIRNERAQLTEDKKPQFGCQEFQEVKVKQKSVDIEVDISGLVNDISTIIALSAGNIAALPNFLKGIKTSLKLCWLSGSTKNRTFNKLKNEKDETIYVRLDYVKVTDETKAVLSFLRAGGSTKTEYMYVSYLVLKPLNDAATRACETMMSEDFEVLRTNLRSAEKDKK